MTQAIDVSDARQRVADHGLWYHTIDIAPGLTTPGWFDLRHAVDGFPWPGVEGKRCLDIGTFDGFFTWELERRGAAEVVSVDIPDHRNWDWPVDSRPGPATADEDLSFMGPPKGTGWRLIAELKGSRADWRPISIYDLSPDLVGTFDVVVVGSLMLHLRDPIRALEAVRSVCDGWLLSSEEIDLPLTLLTRRPVFRLDGSGDLCQWWIGNSAGHERLLWSAGFVVERRGRLYTERFNVHPQPQPGLRRSARERAQRVLTGDPNPGVLHRAVLARNRI